MNYFHSGDLGDVIYALPSIRAMGPGVLYLESRPWTAKMTAQKVAVLKPLLEAQPYVTRVVHGEVPKKEHQVNFSTFRNGGLFFGVSLGELQSDWINANATFEPWLKAAPSRKSKGRIVCHRSPRYNNPYFRWDEIGKKFGDSLMFVGLPEEVNALRRATGVHAEYAVTHDYLELASLIAGADLFIGNQSSPMGLAIGLGVPFIQETCLWTPDCLYRRSNGHYCYDGSLPEFGVPPFDPPPDIDRNAAPPGGWQVVCRRTGERNTFRSHRAALRWLTEQGRLEESEAAEEIDRQNAARVPHLVKRNSSYQIFGKVRPLIEAIT